LVSTFLIITWKTDPDSVVLPEASFIEESISLVDVKQEASFSNYVNQIYDDASLKEAGLSESVFKKAITGFLNLKSKLNSEK
jgi:hypothetical protein